MVKRWRFEVKSEVFRLRNLPADVFWEVGVMQARHVDSRELGHPACLTCGALSCGFIILDHAVDLLCQLLAAPGARYYSV